MNAISDHKLFSDGIHLISIESIEHLHAYCASIGIKRCWFHHGARHPHYDIPKRKRATFFDDHPEVVRVDSREIVRLIQSQNRRP